MRWLIVFVMLASSPVSAAEIFSGADLLALCRTNVPACGDFIRTSLRKQGWSDRTLFAEISSAKRPLWWACPPVYASAKLARLYVAYWRDHAQRLARLSADRATILVFSEDPVERSCAGASKG